MYDGLDVAGVGRVCNSRATSENVQRIRAKERQISSSSVETTAHPPNPFIQGSYQESRIADDQDYCRNEQRAKAILVIIVHETKAVLGIEPRTSRTRSENHTTRPNSQLKPSGSQHCTPALWPRWHQAEFKVDSVVVNLGTHTH